MKTLQSYLEGIKANKSKGWRDAYSDIMGQRLTDTERLLKGVDLYGEEIIFEAILVTASKKLSTPDPLNYMLAVARQIWKDLLQETLTKDQDEIRLERSKRHMKEDNERLAEKLAVAKRRTDASNPL